MARKRKKPEPRRQSRFAVGDRVRVRPGVPHPDWPDVPLGGWAGTVESVGESADDDCPGFVVTIVWNAATSKQMPRIFHVRSEREGLALERMNLSEDEVVPDDGAPVVLEQPTNLAPRPLDLDEMEDRI